MIRDPSDGSVREKKELDRILSENMDAIMRPASGLPLEPTKDKAKLEKSRSWLKEYFNRNPEQGT